MDNIFSQPGGTKLTAREFEAHEHELYPQFSSNQAAPESAVQPQVAPSIETDRLREIGQRAIDNGLYDKDLSPYMLKPIAQNEPVVAPVVQQQFQQPAPTVVAPTALPSTPSTVDDVWGIESQGNTTTPQDTFNTTPQVATTAVNTATPITGTQPPPTQGGQGVTEYNKMVANRNAFVKDVQKELLGSADYTGIDVNAALQGLDQLTTADLLHALKTKMGATPPTTQPLTNQWGNTAPVTKPTEGQPKWGGTGQHSSIANSGQPSGGGAIQTNTSFQRRANPAW